MRKKIFFVALIILFPAGYYWFNKNELSDKEETIDLIYSLGCGCPNWSTPAEYKKFGDEFDPHKLGIYIEPAYKEVEIPDTYFVSSNRILFKSRFYKKKGYPEGIRFCFGISIFCNKVRIGYLVSDRKLGLITRSLFSVITKLLFR